LGRQLALGIEFNPLTRLSFDGRTPTMQSLTLIGLLAYFDPGSGSLLVQALVGGMAGILVFAKFLWDSAPRLFRSRQLRDKRPADKVMAEVESRQNRN
jgi:hypothetical protein